MRSCSNAAHCCFCSSVSAPSSHTAMPRSMRSMPAKPQFSAILVALEAHGEIVPKRGVTKNKCKPSRAFGVCSTLCAANKACSFSTVAASNAFSLPTKYQNSLLNLTSGRPSAAAFCKSFSTRKSERAVTPRKGKTTDMDSALKCGWEKEGLYAGQVCIAWIFWLKMLTIFRRHTVGENTGAV